MAVHDWTRVAAGIFHALHVGWISDLSGTLNQILPSQLYYSIPKQIAKESIPDITIPLKSEVNYYAAKANAIAIHHVSNHRVVAMVEIVSPGNKNNQNGLNAFVRKAREALAAGIHLLIVDLFPPSPRDPQGIHGAIWSEDCDRDYVVSEEQPLACVSYIGGAAAEAFIEPFAVGQPLPDMPLFLTSEVYISVPLAATYQSAFDRIPAFWRDVLSSPHDAKDVS
jgi:hypothetical protein